MESVGANQAGPRPDKTVAVALRHWDVDAWGTPLSAAHVGMAAADFSARMLMHSERMGAAFSREERDGFMHVWRYSAHLMGIPETILFKSEEDALKLYDIGIMCEPPIDM